MTASELTGLIGALGFPIFLVLALLWIFIKHLWPWFVVDQKQRREAETQRHADYLKAIERQSQSSEIMAKTFIEMATATKEQHEQISTTAATNQGVLINIVEKNHTDVVRRLERIDGKIPNNGFGVKPSHG